MTLNEARLLIAQTQSSAQRAAAEQLLNEAIALPDLPPEQRHAAIARIRGLEPTVPDYQLRSFGLMSLAGGDGTANASFSGGLIVISGPPATLVAGIGLLRRWRWAYGCVLALLAVFAAYNVVQLLRGSTPERSTVSPDGVTQTVLASNANHSLHLLIIAISVGLLVKLLTPAIRAGFSQRPQA